jgi:hypothetical protein
MTKPTRKEFEVACIKLHKLLDKGAELSKQDRMQLGLVGELLDELNETYETCEYGLALYGNDDLPEYLPGLSLSPCKN